MNVLKPVAFVIALSAAAASGQATAAILNISATSEVGEAFDFLAGHTYRIEWIGMADGGMYDAANVNCIAAACATGWTNAITSRDSDYEASLIDGLNVTSSPATLQIGALGATYGSAAASLAAWQTGPLTQYRVDIKNGVMSAPFIEADNLSSPLIGSIDDETAGTIHFVVADLDQNRSNNQGGVSLRITDVDAVPEPATWAVMLSGLAGLGVAARRRRRGLAATA